MQAKSRHQKAIQENENELRDSLWTKADELCWKHKEYGGFVTIPKTMPYICRILDEMSKNFPLSSTYQALWSFTWSNNAFIKLNKISDIAYAASFTGQRGQRTLHDRMKRLERIGFIETKPSGGEKFGFVFIPNPHALIMELRNAKQTANAPKPLRERAALLQEASLNAFLARAIEIKCKDVISMLSIDSQGETKKSKK
jgi:hypothetical protein